MIVRALALGLGLLSISGCAGFASHDRECRVAEGPSLPYTVMSRTERTDDLPAGTLISAHRYQLRPQQFQVTPCNDLLIVRELHARTAVPRRFALTEVREFYSSDGKLIARAQENLSKQITRSGLYRGILALPIPRMTPPGIYRMVGKLYVDGPDKTPILLNEASTEFEVLAGAAAASPAKANAAGTRTGKPTPVTTRKLGGTTSKNPAPAVGPS